MVRDAARDKNVATAHGHHELRGIINIDLTLALAGFALASAKPFDRQYMYPPNEIAVDVTYASPQLHLLSPHAPAWLTRIEFTYQKAP